MRSAEPPPPLPGGTTASKPGVYERNLTGEVYLLHISVWLLYMINLNIPVKLEEHNGVLRFDPGDTNVMFRWSFCTLELMSHQGELMQCVQDVSD